LRRKFTKYYRWIKNFRCRIVCNTPPIVSNFKGLVASGDNWGKIHVRSIHNGTRFIYKKVSDYQIEDLIANIDVNENGIDDFIWSDSGGRVSVLSGGVVGPTLGSPKDKTIIRGTTGNEIKWSVITKLHKSRTITENGQSYSSGNLVDDTLTLNIDNLGLGVHVINLTVTDKYDLMNYDIVMVNVQNMPITAAIPGFEVLYAFLAIMSFGLLYIFLKK